MSELHDLTALEQGAAVARREVSPVELVDHYLARVARLSDAVGAFVTVTGELAREQALLAQQRGGRGRGPLFGVPTAVKDLNLTAGVRTTFGSAVFADFVPDVSDEVVLRLEAAGLVSLGKTSTPEFGSPCYTEPDVAPASRTPWDLERMAGGSSGGAGAAVAAGLVPLGAGFRRRRFDPDPGELLRAGRSQAQPRPDQRGAGVRRPGRPGHGRPAGPHRARRRGAAGRDGGAGGRRPGLGRAAARGRELPGLVRPHPGPAARRPVRLAGDHRRACRPGGPGGLRVGEQAAGRARPRGRGRRGADVAGRRTRVRDLTPRVQAAATARPGGAGPGTGSWNAVP